MAQGSGSGVIIDDRGYIVTNNHVIDQADEIVVSLNDNRSYRLSLLERILRPTWLYLKSNLLKLYQPCLLALPTTFKSANGFLLWAIHLT